MTFDFTEVERKSFDQGFYRPTRINGPITLVRFSHSGSSDFGRYGRYWLYGDYVHDLLRASHNALSLIKEISQQWAICDDWGDKKLLTLMDIPPNGSVPALWGRAKTQPKLSIEFQKKEDNRRTSHSYEGGALQLLIPVRNTDKVLDPSITSFISRKFETARLLTNPAMLLENPWVTAQRQKGRNI